MKTATTRKKQAITIILSAAICGGIVICATIALSGGFIRETRPRAAEAGPGPAPQNQRPILAAHRGAPQLAPENSIAGFRRAAVQGARFIEFDLVMSRDGVIYVCHDSNLKRTTGADINISHADSARLDGVKLPNGEKLPRLEEVFNKLNVNLSYIIETKSRSGGQGRKMDRELIRLLKKYHMENRVILSSQSLVSLSTLHEALDSPPYMYIFASRGMKEAPAARLKSVPGWISAVSISKDRVTPRTMRSARARGLKVALFTVSNTNDMRQAMKYGPEIIFTDNMRLSMMYLNIISPAMQVGRPREIPGCPAV
jgi:glycerophosphoryl diester phosphodiesterase